VGYGVNGFPQLKGNVFAPAGGGLRWSWGLGPRAELPSQAGCRWHDIGRKRNLSVPIIVREISLPHDRAQSTIQETPCFQALPYPLPVAHPLTSDAHHRLGNQFRAGTHRHRPI